MGVEVNNESDVSVDENEIVALAGFVLSVAGCLVLVGSLDARRGPVRLQPVWKAA